MKNVTSPWRVLIIHSPRSGRSEHLCHAMTLLREAGVEIVASHSIGEFDGLPPQGERWRSQGIGAVIAAGGDGLIGGVVSHVVESKLPIGILPLGTANDVARTIDVPQDIAQAVRTIVEGKQIAIDLGQAHPAQQSPHASQPDGVSTSSITPSSAMYFAHALTVGLNVQFARLATDKGRREQFGAWTYPVAVVEALRAYKPLDVEVQLHGLLTSNQETKQRFIQEQPVIFQGTCAQVTAVNAAIFWGALQVAVPGVSLEDRLLDVIIVEEAGIETLLFRAARFFGRREERAPGQDSWHARYPQLLAAELNDTPGIHHFKTRSLIISTPDQSYDATLDGEVRGRTPIDVRVAQEQACFIVPQAYKQS